MCGGAALAWYGLVRFELIISINFLLFFFSCHSHCVLTYNIHSFASIQVVVKQVDGSMLQLQNVQRNDMGNYYCVARYFTMTILLVCFSGVCAFLASAEKCLQQI